MRLSGLASAAPLATVVATAQCGGTPFVFALDGSEAGAADAAGDANATDATAGDAGCAGRCGSGRLCCGTLCVNPGNDPMHCGDCGTACTSAKSYCNGGSCQAPPCRGGACLAGTTCCGAVCCATGQLCCNVQGPISTIECYTPTPMQPTCPLGCTACVSDRNLKRGVEPVDPAEILEKLARVPISTWSYRSDDSSVRHLGPMAQDFHAAFGLGNTDRAYDPVDAHGVAFAAIQALDRQVREQNERIERLERENEALRRRVCANDSQGP